MHPHTTQPKSHVKSQADSRAQSKTQNKKSRQIAREFTPLQKKKNTRASTSLKTGSASISEATSIRTRPGGRAPVGRRASRGCGSRPRGAFETRRSDEPPPPLPPPPKMAGFRVRAAIGRSASQARAARYIRMHADTFFLFFFVFVVLFCFCYCYFILFLFIRD